ncbi:MAG TPA: UDP-3-O-(3-hydroxymyristoyl)glucosamine N-acyltransferase [Gemmataceae bacterium]|nr:UDP-3-O-(3-hydroxymyristoyl)glucosamine N-acyltransferase [Gemmataceae bacterium]
MTVTLRQLAELVHGQVCGDGDLVIHAARTLAEARPGDISFLETDKHAVHLPTCHASALVVPPGAAGDGRPVIRVADPLTAFVAIVRHLHGGRHETPPGIDPRAVLHPTCQVGPGASVGPLVTVGEGSVVGARCRLYPGVVIGAHCRLGEDVVLYPNVVLYEGTILGNRVVVHANAVLGADGFGYRLQDGRHVKVPQLGHVEVGDDVEIGACTTIDRGTFQATRIGDGTKIDNLVQVGHNCQIGRHNLFVSQMGIAGSSTTGDYVVIAGQVGIVDHVHIGDRVLIGAKAGVTKDVAPGERMLGAPATPEREQKRILMSLEKLPELRRDIRRLKQHLGITDGEG